MSIKLYDAEIEYLESSGGSRMSIPFVWDKLYTVEISYYVIDSVDQLNIFRTNGKLANNVFLKAFKSMNAIEYGYGSANMKYIPYKTGRHTSVVTATYSQHDGIKKNWNVTNVKDNTEIYLFQHIIDTEAKARIYYAIVKDPNSLENVIDFIPVRIGNVGYMYDKVSGKLFGNSGTGSFVLGPDVSYDVPEANEVAFLESWGNQYIDTGIKPSTDTKIELKCLYCKSGAGLTSYGALIGADDRDNAYILNHSAVANFTYGLEFSNNFANPQTRLLTFNSTAAPHNMRVYDEGGSLVTTLTCLRGVFEVNQNLYLFAANRNGTPVYGSNRILYCKIYDGDTLVRDYVPVEYNGIGYMYDKVSGLFFDNKGTGKFLFGSIAKACARSYTRRQLMMEIGKPYDAEIEYLQSNAASGFNIVTNNEFPVQCTFELKYKIDNILGIYDYQTFFSRVTTPFRTPSVYMAGRSSGYYYQTPDTSGRSKNLLRLTIRNTDLHTLVVNFENRTITLDGEQSAFADSFTQYTVPSKMCLFSAVTSDRFGLYGKIYYFKITKNNQVLLDLIPVRKGNVGMMYDKVTGAVYKNTSTGTFIVGPDI